MQSPHTIVFDAKELKGDGPAKLRRDSLDPCDAGLNDVHHILRAWAHSKGEVGIAACGSIVVNKEAIAGACREGIEVVLRQI
jgi:hypothetical protein